MAGKKNDFAELSLGELIDELRATKQEALNLLHEEAVRAFDAGATGPFDLVEAYGRRSRGGSPPVK